MQVAFKTDVGKRRPENQDFVDVFENLIGTKLAMVADGIGGHQGGDVASAMAVSHVGHEFETTKVACPEEGFSFMQQQVQQENRTIISRAAQFADLKGMGTTVVMAMIFDQAILVGNIGDSRAYLLRDDHFEQLTEDHSLVNELVKRGELTPSEAVHHPQKNIIIRSLGISSEANIDMHEFNVMPDDVLLLCTDGLTNMVSDESIKDILMTDLTLQEKCQTLIDSANAAGGLDNITVLLATNESEVAAHA